MRRLSHIMVVATALILLVFGKGGVVVERCVCSGRLLSVFEADNCCGEGSDCMTTIIVQPVDDGCNDALQAWCCNALYYATVHSIEPQHDMCVETGVALPCNTVHSPPRVAVNTPLRV